MPSVRVADNGAMFAALPLTLSTDVLSGCWRGKGVPMNGVYVGTVDRHEPITIAVGRLQMPPSARSDLRQAQGRSARELLLTCLQERYPDVAQDAWAVSAPGGERPTVAGPRPLEISFSHRGPWIACAFSEGGQLGVDIESMSPAIAIDAWDLFLHAEEMAVLEALPVSQRSVVALANWCRKEAWLKASGQARQVAMTELAFSPSGRLSVAPPDAKLAPAGWHSHVWSVDSQCLVALSY